MLRDRIRDLMPQARADLAEMVTFRSVHDTAQFPVSGCDAMVDWLVDAFTTAGLSDVQAHVTADGSKAVTGVRPGPPGSKTVLLYFHHDVQPPLDDAAWHSSPWELVERDGRWFGRGTADDKGSIAVGRPTLTTSLRGVADLVVSVETSRTVLHSGMFGGPAPDALAALVKMLATLRDDDGNTTIDGLDATGR